MGLALYRKYRPKGLADVVGQDHIVTTLKNALKSGKISHAYLFTGPRGVGKTSIARILAHEINGLEYTDDTMHLDIIEIDAASNRRIDEIRDLRDKVHIAPTSAKYKVYIIDEVHMLTREAFNALLKTLEEPPAHVVFILATTEAHKVPDTIASRTQRFSFKPIVRGDTVSHLRDLAKQEKVSISDEALEALADHANGSFRDSINLLDQMIGSGDKIDKQDVEAMLGLPNPEIITTLFNAMSSGDVSALVESLGEARINGVNAGLLAKALGEKIRADIIERREAPDARTTILLRNLLEAASHRDAFASLELALFDFISVEGTPAPRPLPVTAPVAKKPIIEEVTKKEPKPEAKQEPEPIEEVSAPEPEPAAAVELGPVADEEFWGALLDATKKAHNTVYGILRMARPQLVDDQLTLVFGFAFHQKQMSQATNHKRIADAASALLGRPISVKSIHQKDVEAMPAPTPKPKAKTEAAKSKESTSLTDVSSIFNGAELLD